MVLDFRVGRMGCAEVEHGAGETGRKSEEGRETSMSVRVDKEEGVETSGSPLGPKVRGVSGPTVEVRLPTESESVDDFGEVQ